MHFYLCQGGFVFGSIGLFVCLLATLLKSYIQILMKCSRKLIAMIHGTNHRLNFGGGPDHYADWLIGNPATTQQIMSRF